MLTAIALAVAGGLGVRASGAIEPPGKKQPVLGAVAPPAGEAAGSESRPNIVVIVSDDQTASLYNRRMMPATKSLLGDRGASFKNSIVTTPLCCPARATNVTGQYAHNHGILANAPGYSELSDPENVLPAWLQRAGYVTAHVGKYLNNHQKVLGPDTVAPGWDEWYTQLKPYSYYDYALAVNGGIQRFGTSEDEYLTRVLTDRARRVIKQHVPEKEPLYLQLDQFAPHQERGDSGGRCGGEAVPDPRDRELVYEARLPRPPSFNEPDVSDKPAFIERLERLGEKKDAVRLTYRCQVASLRGLDRGTRQVYRAIEEAGELDNTVFIFTSDNGLFFGEHRIPGSKKLPYEEALQVPLVVRMPGAQKVKIKEPVANIDIVPTILELADAEPCVSALSCRTMDGRSLLDLLVGDGEWPDGRAIVVELSDPNRVSRKHSCAYQGLRLAHRIYVRHILTPDRRGRVCRDRVEVEHYDLRTDPFELENLHGTAARGKERRLKSRLGELGDCAGIAGRDPVPPSGHYCE